MEKSGGTSSMLYWYGAPGIIAESDLSGTLKSEYVFFNGKRLARIDLPAGTVHYYLSDHLNSTSMVVSGSGAVEDESDYSPYGTEYQITSGANHYKFTGKERDTESGLDYFGARYYSTGLGRFTTPDEPFADEDEGDPQSWNLYMYTSNNPLRYVDPDGRSHVDKNGYIVGDYDGELIDNRSLVWDAKNQQWDRPQAPPPDNGAINPGFLGPFDIFFFGRLPGGSAARVAEEGAAKAAAEAAAKAAAEAAAKAAAEAALKKEIEGLVAKAASTVGNQGIQASSRAAAEQAAREWVGAGARDIVDRQTGKVVGQISADGTKVARFTSAGKSQPYINLVNKTTGGNLHVKF